MGNSQAGLEGRWGVVYTLDVVVKKNTNWLF